jgi:hypothetical protein
MDVIKILFAGVGAIAVFVLFKAFNPALVDHKLLFFVPLACCGIVYVGVLFVLGIVKKILRKETKINEKA